MTELSRIAQVGGRVVVLNAQSGWGKSSLALRISAVVKERALGHAVVVDSRTAISRGYLIAVLRRAALEAQTLGIVRLPDDAAWGTLASAMGTLRRSAWRPGRRLLVFFDQFENVFKDAALTTEFRDLALGAHEIGSGLLVGFAWKTDLVGWTEGHPYQLRDEIRANATVVTLEPFGPREVETLLRRLEKVLGQRILPDLRQRLREYSQGLPWLLKKLAGHLIREAHAGITQEELLAFALNVQNLFEADLAELQPIEQDALRYIARYAPVAAAEITERVNPAVVQSLVDRRLIVQVGERLDTYWDTFRDFLNTGRVPVEDSYILRLDPRSVARLLAVLPDDGNGSVPEIAAGWGTSDKAVFNISRELRLLGITTYESNRVRVNDEIWRAVDREEAARRQVQHALRRHRAYTRLLDLAERGNTRVSISTFERELRSVFPAVQASQAAWPDYARVFSQWFEYAGLIRLIESEVEVTPEGDTSAEPVLFNSRVRIRLTRSFPQKAPGPAIKLLVSIAENGPVRLSSVPMDAVRDLIKIGAVAVNEHGLVSTVKELVREGEVLPERLRTLLTRVPGCGEAIERLTTDPSADPMQIGEIVRSAVGADWAPATTLSAGKYMRAWARHAGVKTALKRRALPTQCPVDEGAGRLF